jgi:hypothetical protein
MFKRQPGKSDANDASVHSRRSAAVDSLWAAQDRARSELGSSFGDAWGALSRAYEAVSFPLRKRVAWPLEDRAEKMGAPARALSFGAVIMLAAGVGVAGLIWAAPDKPDHSTATAPVAATSAPLAAAKATASEQPTEPTLHGATPSFKPAGTATEVDPAKAIVKSAPSASAADSKPATATGATASAANASTAAKDQSIDGPPAGPAAIAVARDFAGAFLVYETGGSDSGVRKAFGETATPALSKALLRRPPRLPANVKVPKAKVVNVVPAPSHGDVYPVSISLLRVGLTSELRLEMEQLKGDGWRVTNVLG